MNQQPLVACGIPVYNGGKYLEECLNSVLKQTWENWECVIVDNKSKDETNAIARKYVEMDKRFRLVENTDFVDQTTNWNIAFENLNKTSKYTKILCADDWMYPEHFEKMVEVMEKHPSIGMCSTYRLDDTKIIGDYLDIYSGQCFQGKNILVDQLYYRCNLLGSVSTVMYRTDVLTKVSGYPDIFKLGTYHIDTELAFELLSLADFGFVFQVLSYTRRHNETYTSQISNRFNTGLYFREKEILKYMNLHPGLPAEYKKVRRDYAFLLLKERFKGNKDLLAWHGKYLDNCRHFTMGEYIDAFLYRMKSKFIRKKKNKV